MQGPYQIFVRWIEQCDDSGTNQIYITNTRISKVSRTKYIFSANLTFEILVGDDASVKLKDDFYTSLINYRKFVFKIKSIS